MILSPSADELLRGLAADELVADDWAEVWLRIPGASVCVAATPPELLELLAHRYAFAGGPPPPCDAKICVSRDRSRLKLTGPAGTFAAECAADGKTFFAHAGSQADAFAGSYSGWRGLGSDGASLAILDAELVRQLFAVSTAAALLHAAWLRIPAGPDLLLAGASGAGKTTLCSAAAAEGWQVLADDMVGLMPDAGLVAFPRRSWPAAQAESPPPWAPTRGQKITASGSLFIVTLAPRAARTRMDRLGSVGALAAIIDSTLLSREASAPAIMSLLSFAPVWSLTPADDDPEASIAALGLGEVGCT